MSDDSPTTTPRLERGFYAAAVRRPVGLLVVFVTLIVVGVIAYQRIPIQMMPAGLSESELTVMINHPGSSAQENEEKVARVIEEQFRTLSDIDNVWSHSGENGTRINVSFKGTTDMALAKAEIRDRIERARPQLPDTVDRIYVWDHGDGDLPVMFFAILVEERSADTDYLVENTVQRALETVDGVSQVQIWGLLDDSVRILLEEDKVRAARLDIGRLVRRLMSDNFAEPLGEVTDGGRQFLLRSDMRFRSLEEIADYPIGGGLRVGDVASVERVKTVRDRLTRIDGREAYYGMVQKESAANVVEVTERLEARIATFEHDPVIAGKVKIHSFFNQGNFIRNSLASLRSTALWGGGLAVAVLFVFLRRVRMTLCVALSIPVSALLAIAYEWAIGGTFNVLTMAGLTLGIGMLVDNSVVVIENIARLRQKQLSGMEAAVAGVRDVGVAVALATATSIVVFMPVVFMGDDPQLSNILLALGRPLWTSLIFSLLVALVFLPVISARIVGDRAAPLERVAHWMTPIARVPVRCIAALVGLVRAGLHYAIAGLFHVSRFVVRIATPLRFVLAATLVALCVLRLKAIPEYAALGRRLDGLGMPAESADLQLRMAALVGFMAVVGIGLLAFGLPAWRRRAGLAPARPASFRPPGDSIMDWLQSSNRALLAWTLEHRLLAAFFAFLAFASVVVPTSNMTITAFGDDEEQTRIVLRVDMEDNFTLEETSAEMEEYERFFEGHRERLGFEHLITRFSPGGGRVELHWSDRQDPKDLTRWRRELREGVPKRAGHELRFSDDQQLDVDSKHFVRFQIRGPEAQTLEHYGQRAIEILARVPGLEDVASPLEDAPEQVRLVLDNETAYTYGVTSDAALQSVSWALRGARLPRYQEGGREVAFLMEYDEEELAGLDTLRDLEVFTMQSVVPLAAFAQIDFQPGQREIFRWNGQTTFDIEARVADPNRQRELVEAGYAALDELDLPRGFTLGRDTSILARSDEQVSSMQSALMLAVVLVFLLMGILFESLMLPVSVLTTIPFAIVGALWTLYLTDTPMDSVGWIGLVILVGVVVNNGIVLIDKIHRLMLEGLPRKEAVLAGAAARVRPILMTALTTVFGLVPMALADAPSEGIDYRALATCVGGGLALSTFFTLWVVPLAYTAMDDLARVLARFWRRVVHWGPLPAGGGGTAPAMRDRA